MAEAGLGGGADSSAPPRRSAGKHLNGIQIMLAVALTIGLVIALNFSSRIQLDRDLGQIHAQFSAEIEALLVDQDALIEELSYVKSDAYVAYWARDEGKMIRDGEVLIMPKSVGAPVTQQRSTVRLVEFQTTIPEPENWQLWWALFFDAPPPNWN